MDINDFDELASIGTGGYEWTDGSLLKRKSDGTLYFVVFSGCSCDSWDEEFASETEELLQEAKVANWQEAVEEAKRIAKDQYSGWSDAEVAEFAKRCMAL